MAIGALLDFAKNAELAGFFQMKITIHLNAFIIKGLSYRELRISTAFEILLLLLIFPTYEI